MRPHVCVMHVKTDDKTSYGTLREKNHVCGNVTLRAGLVSCVQEQIRSGVCFGVGSARWPDGPRQSGVAQRLSLIPFSVVGVVVDEVKTGWNAENSGTPISDMVRG